MLARLVPDRIPILNIVRVLTRLQRAIPRPVGPIATPAADFALERGIEQQVGPHLHRLFLAHMLGVIGDAGGAVIIGHSRQPVGRDLAEGFDHGGHDIGEVWNIRLVQHHVIAIIDPALVPCNARAMQDVVAIGVAGGLDLGQNLVFAAECGIDHLVAGGGLIGVKGVLAQRLRDDTAPAFEMQFGAHGAGLCGHGGHDPARKPCGQTRRAQKAKECPAIHIAIAHRLAQAGVARHAVNFLGHWSSPMLFLIILCGVKNTGPARPPIAEGPR